MLNREGIYKIVKDYLPTAKEDLLNSLAEQAEQQIDLLGKSVIRKLVLQRANQELVTVRSKIDTRV